MDCYHIRAGCLWSGRPRSSRPWRPRRASPGAFAAAADSSSDGAVLGRCMGAAGSSNKGGGGSRHGTHQLSCSVPPMRHGENPHHAETQTQQGRPKCGVVQTKQSLVTRGLSSTGRRRSSTPKGPGKGTKWRMQHRDIYRLGPFRVPGHSSQYAHKHKHMTIQPGQRQFLARGGLTPLNYPQRKHRTRTQSPIA